MSRSALRLHEDLRKGVYVAGLNEESVADAQDCLNVMERGVGELIECSCVKMFVCLLML